MICKILSTAAEVGCKQPITERINRRVQRLAKVFFLGCVTHLWAHMVSHTTHEAYLCIEGAVGVVLGKRRRFGFTWTASNVESSSSSEIKIGCRKLPRNGISPRSLAKEGHLRSGRGKQSLLYSAVQTNMLQGCVSHNIYHATFDQVYGPFRSACSCLRWLSTNRKDRNHYHWLTI